MALVEEQWHRRCSDLFAQDRKEVESWGVDHARHFRESLLRLVIGDLRGDLVTDRKDDEEQLEAMLPGESRELPEERLHVVPSRGAPGSPPSRESYSR